QGIADRFGMRNRKIAAQNPLRPIWPDADHSALFVWFGSAHVFFAMRRLTRLPSLKAKRAPGYLSRFLKERGTPAPFIGRMTIAAAIRRCLLLGGHPMSR